MRFATKFFLLNVGPFFATALALMVNYLCGNISSRQLVVGLSLLGTPILIGYAWAYGASTIRKRRRRLKIRQM